MENTIPQNQIKKPNKKWFWIIAGFFIIYLGWSIFSGLSNKDEQLCIYEIPASVEWQMENNKTLVERAISLWEFEVAVKEYNLKYIGEGTDDTILKNTTLFEINYCDLSKRIDIEIPFKKRLL